MGIKGIIKYPWRRLQRFRISRGFSVHSPFAFYFITKVLREQLPYYCFKTEITTRAQRRLFRVVHYFHPATVCLVGACQPHVKRVILKACPTAKFVSNPTEAEFTYVASGEIPTATPVAFSEQCASAPADAMTFSNGTVLIAVRRKSLPCQHFVLSF